MQKTQKGNRIHIAILGRRNVGKSSFMNLFLGQDFSIVSNTPGTTTDPVEKTYELQPIGPVVLIDTAGIDDVGELGEKRIEKTVKIMRRADVALLIVERDKWGKFEEDLIEIISEKKIPWMIVINKADLDIQPTAKQAADRFLKDLKYTQKVPVKRCSAATGEGFEEVKDTLALMLSKREPEPPIIADLVSPPDTVVLVIPIDKEAPKGRLILPQVQTIRELLDSDVTAVAVKERELFHTLNNVLAVPPALVVTDSQAFLKVYGDVPDNVKLTSFSILFARHKGDLESYVHGLAGVPKLKDGDKILISELCSHRPISEDIGRVKIPRWLRQYSGLELDFHVSAGYDFPIDLSEYALIIQCGGCVSNRSEIITRIRTAEKQNVPITNYGVMIAFMHGIIEKALEPFPSALETWKEIERSF